MGHFYFFGCSFMMTPEYPEPILLDANPSVAVRYEYGNIQLKLQTQIFDGNPTAYRFSVFNQSDSISPLISKIFFPDSETTGTQPSPCASRCRKAIQTG